MRTEPETLDEMGTIDSAELSASVLLQYTLGVLAERRKNI